MTTEPLRQDPNKIATQPPQFAQHHAQHRAFARLVPLSRAAMVAFSNAYMVLRDNPDTNEPMLKHMQASDVPKNAPSGWAKELEFGILWHGHYSLNLDSPPRDLTQGWIMGIGGLDWEEKKIDIPLSFSKVSQESCIVVGRLVHGNANILTIVAEGASPWPIRLNGVEIPKNERRPLWTKRTGVTIGKLEYSYRLEFTKLSRSEYRMQLEAKRIEGGFGDRLHRLVDPLPGASNFMYQDWIIGPPIDNERSGEVCPAIRMKDSQLVAVKEMLRPKTYTDDYLSELNVMIKLRSHANVCGLANVLQFSQTSGPAGPDLRGKVRLVLEPLAQDTVGVITLSDMSDEDRVEVVVQCLSGLAHIHSKGIMHRDLNPSNLAVDLSHPLRATIIGFGLATTRQTSKEEIVARPEYCAPEVMDLRKDSTLAPYDRQVDIWALGVCSLELLSCNPGLCAGSTPSIASAIHYWIRRLKGMVSLKPCAASIETMLNRRPGMRGTASTALERIQAQRAGKVHGSSFEQTRGLGIEAEGSSSKRQRLS